MAKFSLVFVWFGSRGDGKVAEHSPSAQITIFPITRKNLIAFVMWSKTWWLENPYFLLQVVSLFSQQSSYCLSNFSMEFISVGYLDTANTFWVSLRPVKLNKTCTPCLLSLNKLSVSPVTSVASSAPISLVNSAFLQRDGQNHKGRVFPELCTFPLPSSDKLL